MGMPPSTFIIFLFLLANSPTSIQAFLFPPSASAGCSCPPAQCPAAPAAHCVWKRQAGGEGENVASLVEDGEPERIGDGADGGGAGGQAGGGPIGQGDEAQMDGDEAMGMVYDDDLASAPTERTTRGQQQSTTKLAETVGEIGGRTLQSTIQPSSSPPPILSSIESAPSSTIATNTIGTFAPSNGQNAVGDELKQRGEGEHQKKQQKEPLTKGKGGGGKLATAKIVPEKTGGNSSGQTSTGTPNGASRNCNSELMRQIMLEHINLKPTIAKRQIQAQVSAQLGGRIDVVCAKKAFSYIVNSELFCEVEKNGTICLCYRQQQA